MCINIWRVLYTVYTWWTQKPKCLAVSCSFGEPHHTMPCHTTKWVGDTRRERESMYRGRKIHWNGKSGIEFICELNTYTLDACKCTWYAHGLIQTNAQKREMLAALCFLLLLSLQVFFASSKLRSLFTFYNLNACSSKATTVHAATHLKFVIHVYMQLTAWYTNEIKHTACATTAHYTHSHQLHIS